MPMTFSKGPALAVICEGSSEKECVMALEPLVSELNCSTTSDTKVKHNVTVNHSVIINHGVIVNHFQPEKHEESNIKTSQSNISSTPTESNCKNDSSEILLDKNNSSL